GPAPRLVGASRAMETVRAHIAKAAAIDSTVLLTGESGTGKELVARAIHDASGRRLHRFVPVNCAAIPETLFESQLFGHVRGAFTSAVRSSPGLFAAADRGTLFLDEVAELPLHLQVKLLRVLEERQIWAVGATHPARFDVRIIAATNRDLRRDVAAGRFREDLFYRLNVVRIVLPPLRDHREDIPLLVAHMIPPLNERLDRRFAGIEPSALDSLLTHEWRGNVRELQHVLERAMTVGDGPLITRDLLPEEPGPPPASGSLKEAMRQFERQKIREALACSGFDKREAARRLGLSLASLYRKLA
ncbi:MAG: sigma-54 interaction domain-containing protein, partial [Candidatus Rokuibacteriota bacterium]